VAGRALQLHNPCLVPEAPDQTGTMDVLWATRGAAGRRSRESDHKERLSRPIIAMTHTNLTSGTSWVSTTSHADQGLSFDTIFARDFHSLLL
jgi:hypothetical protein